MQKKWLYPLPFLLFNFIVVTLYGVVSKNIFESENYEFLLSLSAISSLFYATINTVLFLLIRKLRIRYQHFNVYGYYILIVSVLGIMQSLVYVMMGSYAINFGFLITIATYIFVALGLLFMITNWSKVKMLNILFIITLIIAVLSSLPMNSLLRDIYMNSNYGRLNDYMSLMTKVRYFAILINCTYIYYSFSDHPELEIE